MNTCLKIGEHSLDGDQLISALVRYGILETLVGQVLLDEALQQVPLSERELFEALVGTTNAPLPEDFDHFVTQWCHHKGLSPDYLNVVLLRELRVEKFKQQYFAHQVEAEFLHTKSEFDQVEYSLIQLADLPLAQEFYFQIRDDEADFGELAYYSLGRERHMRGWVGPVSMSALPDDIATLFRSSPVGTVHEPIAVADRFWIVRLEQFTEARLTEEMRITILNRLYGRWLQTKVRSLLSTPGSITVQSDTTSHPAVSIPNPLPTAS